MLRSTVLMCFEGVFLHSKRGLGWVEVKVGQCSRWELHRVSSSAKLKQEFCHNIREFTQISECPPCWHAPKPSFLSITISVPKFSTVFLNEFHLETSQQWDPCEACRYFCIEIFCSSLFHRKSAIFFKWMLFF